MDYKKSDIQKWCNALRSGKYLQGKNQLADLVNGKARYCCLGVACDIFIPKEKQVINPNTGLLKGYFFENQKSTPKWLRQILKNFTRKTDKLLSDLNDGYYDYHTVRPFTFDEIADLLEAIYIHKVLG